VPSEMLLQRWKHMMLHLEYYTT